MFYLLHSYNPSFLICLCFNIVSFRGQKKLGPCPDRSPLGVSFKISDEHPHPFICQEPPSPGDQPSSLQFPFFSKMIKILSITMLGNHLLVLQQHLSQKEKTANISRHHHDWFPREMTSDKQLQKFHTDDVSLPRSG